MADVIASDEDWSADRVRALRARTGLSQERFAQRVGVSFACVNRWENGHAKPSRLACDALARLETVEGRNHGSATKED